MGTCGFRELPGHYCDIARSIIIIITVTAIIAIFITFILSSLNLPFSSAGALSLSLPPLPTLGLKLQMSLWGIPSGVRLRVRAVEILGTGLKRSLASANNLNLQHSRLNLSPEPYMPKHYKP